MTNRRNFIKSGALLGASLAWPASLSFGKQVLGKDKVRIGVIGAGDRGTGLINLIQQVEGLEVTAIADVIPFRLQAAGDLVSKAMTYSAHEPLLEDKNIDAVIIATPFSTHGDIAMMAMDAGLHVYCEKTMVKGLDQIIEVVDKAKVAKGIFQTGHQYHSSPLYNKVRGIVKSGYIGEVTAYHCQWARNGDWRRPVPDPKWERMINWRMYKEYSGGLVAELLSHQIDFINWVTDSQPTKIMGTGGIDHWKDGRETYDNVHVLMEYLNGLDASFSSTTTNAYEDYQIKILGKKGTIILGYNQAKVYAERTGGEMVEKGLVDGVSGATLQAWEQGEGAPIDAPGNDPTLDALKQFYESIVNDAPVISDIKTGALTAKCVDLALDAIYNDKVTLWKDYPKIKFSK